MLSEQYHFWHSSNKNVVLLGMKNESRNKINQIWDWIEDRRRRINWTTAVFMRNQFFWSVVWFGIANTRREWCGINLGKNCTNISKSLRQCIDHVSTNFANAEKISVNSRKMPSSTTSNTLYLILWNDLFHSPRIGLMNFCGWMWWISGFCLSLCGCRHIPSLLNETK